jgi:hypothetical protein
MRFTTIGKTNLINNLGVTYTAGILHDGSSIETDELEASIIPTIIEKRSNPLNLQKKSLTSLRSRDAAPTQLV